MFEQVEVKRLPTRIPYSVLIPLLCIVGIGVLNLSSAAQATRPDLYINQIVRFGLALVLMTTAALVHTRYIRQLAFLAYAVSILLLVLVLAVGTTAKGAERWLVLGPMRLQPSDPAKLALVLAIARYCSMNWPAHGYSISDAVASTKYFAAHRLFGFDGIGVG